MPIARHVSSASNVPQHTSIQGFRSTLNPMAQIISGYRISRVPTPCSVDSSNVQVSEIPIACHVSYDSNGQDCYRDFAYREFEGLENLFPLDFPDLRNSEMKPLSRSDCFPRVLLGSTVLLLSGLSKPASSCT
jgi:hypothetical protein